MSRDDTNDNNIGELIAQDLLNTYRNSSNSLPNQEDVIQTLINDITNNQVEALRYDGSGTNEELETLKALVIEALLDHNQKTIISEQSQQLDEITQSDGSARQPEVNRIALDASLAGTPGNWRVIEARRRNQDYINQVDIFALQNPEYPVRIMVPFNRVIPNQNPERLEEMKRSHYERFNHTNQERMSNFIDNNITDIAKRALIKSGGDENKLSNNEFLGKMFNEHKSLLPARPVPIRGRGEDFPELNLEVNKNSFARLKGEIAILKPRRDEFVAEAINYVEQKRNTRAR
ncbi:MAG: hypothetical protein SFT91_05535 [Rickettsiaceae bacterium]|nr:hypothetical protein [Rickettsiaceae bacterium]